MGKCYNEEATCLKVCPSSGGQWEIPTLLGPVKSIHGNVPMMVVTMNFNKSILCTKYL